MVNRITAGGRKILSVRRWEMREEMRRDEVGLMQDKHKNLKMTRRRGEKRQESSDRCLRRLGRINDMIRGNLE